MLGGLLQDEWVQLGQAMCAEFWCMHDPGFLQKLSGGDRKTADAEIEKMCFLVCVSQWAGQNQLFREK